MSRGGASQTLGGRKGAVEKSQIVRIKRFALAASIVFQHFFDQSLKLIGVCGSRSPTTFILVDFMEEQLSEGILPLFGHLLQSLNGLF